MIFDELLGAIDDTYINVYDTTENDLHHTLFDGYDGDFSYEKVSRDIAGVEVVRVWAYGDALCVCLDGYEE